MITSNGKSIVVVDDKRDIVNQIKRSLEAMDGLKVYKFTDPFAALEHFNPGCKDHHIVISDIRMPGMNGYEFIKKVKRIKPECRTILMSAFDTTNVEFSKVLPGITIDTFLQKPFPIRKLRGLIIEKYSN